MRVRAKVLKYTAVALALAGMLTALVIAIISNM